MHTLNTARTLLLATAAAAQLLMAGCATAPPTANGMAATPMGTVSTFHRKSSGSLGSFDGQVVWTQKPGTWQGRPMLASEAPQAGTSLHDPTTQALVASLNRAGQPVMSYDPPLDFQWPLQVGKTWAAENTVTLYPSGNKVKIRVDYQVESWGDVTVPAGTFKAFKLRFTNNLGESEVRWVSPADGIPTVKRRVERLATHPQGAGVLDAELLSRVLPGR